MIETLQTAAIVLLLAWNLILSRKLAKLSEHSVQCNDMIDSHQHQETARSG